MATVEAAINIVLNGQERINRLLEGLDDVSETIARINRAPINLRSGPVDQSLERTLTARERSLQRFERVREQIAERRERAEQRFQRRSAQLFQSIAVNSRIANDETRSARQRVAAATAVDRAILRQASAQQAFTDATQESQEALENANDAQRRAIAVSNERERGLRRNINTLNEINRLTRSFTNAGGEGFGRNFRPAELQETIRLFRDLASSVEVGSANFRRFTIASAAASIESGREQRRRFAILADASRGEGRQEMTPQFGGLNRAIDDLVAAFPTVARSRAGLESYRDQLQEIESLTPFASRNSLRLANAIAQVNTELSRASNRPRAFGPEPVRPSGPAVEIGSIRAAQESFKYEKLVNVEIGKQLSLIDKIDTASIDALEKSNLRQRVERAQLAIDEGRLDVAQRLNVETDRILQKQIKLARPTTQTFGALGTGFTPVSGKLPSGFVAFGSPEEEKQRTEFASRRAEVEKKVARVQTEINDILTTQAEKDRLLNQLGLARQEIQQGNLDFADKIAKRTQSDARISRRDFKDRQIQATLLNNALEAGFTEVDRATGSATKEAEKLKKQLDELEQSFGARGQKAEFRADVADFGRRVEDAAAYKRSLQALPGQITELQTIQNNWNKARAKGVKITQEDEQALQNLLGKLRDPGFVVTSATRAQVDEYIKVFRRRTRLRQSESEFSQGGAGVETIERRRSRLLENALNYQRSLSAIEEKGFNLADQRAQLEQKILDIRKAQGAATQTDLEILARGLQDIRTSVAEARGTQQAESALTGFPKTLEALKTSLRTSQTYFSGMDPRQAVNEIYKQFNKPNAAIQQQAGDQGIDSVADNVTDTYASTIRSGIPKAAKAMMELGKAGLDAIRKALRMASPSRAMIEIAQNVVDTFVNYLTASGPIIRSTLQSVFEPKVEQRTEYEQMLDRFRADMAGLTRRPRLYGRMLSQLPEEGITTDMVGAANDVYSMRSLPGAIEAQIRESYVKKFGKLPLFFEDTFDLILRSFTEFGPALVEALDPRRIAGALKASGRALPPGEGTAEYQRMLSGLKTGMAGLTSNPLYYGGLLSRLPNEAITTGMTGAASDVYGKRRLPASLESEIENAFFREFGRIPSFFEVIVDQIFATVRRLSATSVKPVSIAAIPVRPSLPALPPAREMGDVQALRVERALRRSQERSAAVLAEDAARRAERTLPDVVGATASVLDSAVDNAQSGQKTLKDAVLKFFSGLASRLTGAGGGGGGGGRPPGGGPGSLDPDEARRQLAEETQRITGAEKFPDITRLSLQNLEAFGQALTQLRSQLDPTAKGFNQLEKELRDNLGAIQRRQQQLDPNADFLTSRLDPRLARGVSEGLIGGAFPLLFGQGVGASVGGGLGGFAGGFAGGSLGFGLSLVGTALGTAFDTFNTNLQELAKSLKDPTASLEAMKTAGLRVTPEFEFLIQKLESSGRAAEAQQRIFAELENQLGAGAVDQLRALNSEQKELDRQWQSLSATLTSKLLPAVIGTAATINDAINGFKSLGSIKLPGWLQKAIDMGFEGQLGIASVANPGFGLSRFFFENAVGRGKREAAGQTGKPEELSPQKQEEALNAQIQAADRIRSLRQQGVDLERSGVDLRQNIEDSVYQLRRRASDLEREAVEFRRSVEDEVFKKRQEVERKLIDNERQRRQNAIIAFDLELQRASEGLNPVSQGIVDAARQYLRVRAEGEADLQQREKELKLELQRLDREAEGYRLEVQKRVAQLTIQREEFSRDVSRAKLQMERSIGDYIVKIEEYRLEMAKRRYELEVDGARRAQIAAQEGLTLGATGGMTRGGRPAWGGAPAAVIEYYTGDPAMRGTPAYDPRGHGGSRHHEHVAFSSTEAKDIAIRALQAAGLMIGSQYRPGDPGFHGQGLAIDVPAYPNFARMGFPDNEQGERMLGALVRSVINRAFAGTSASAGQRLGAAASGATPVAAAAASIGAAAPPAPPEIPSLPRAPQLVGIEDLMKKLLKLQRDYENALISGNRILAERAVLETAAARFAFEQQTLGPIRQFQQQNKELDLEIQKRLIRNRLLMEGVPEEAIRGQLQELEISRTLAQTIEGLNVATREQVQEALKRQGLNTDLVNSTFALTTATLENLVAQTADIQKKKELREELQRILELQSQISGKLAIETVDAAAGARLTAAQFAVSELDAITQGVRKDQARRELYAKFLAKGMAGEEVARAVQITQLEEIARLEYQATIAAVNRQIAQTGATKKLQEQLDAAEKGLAELPAKTREAMVALQESGSFSNVVQAEIDKVQESLNELLKPANQVIFIANTIGDAFSNAFKGLIAGSTSAREALGNFFRSLADSFADMAAQIIRQWLVMQVLGIFKSIGFPGLASGGVFGGGSSGVSPVPLQGVPFANANGNAFAGNRIVPFAMGGTFTNSVVSSPTLFKFADGAGLSTGVMGEAGPEAIMPLKRGPGGRLGVEASGAGGGQPVSVVVNVDAKGTGVSGNDQGGNELGRAIAAAVQQELIRQQRPGGILAR